MEKKDLSYMLKEIQEMKLEYYIGTQEAYERIMDRRSVEINPTICSEIINKSVKKYISKPSYLATPARLVGLHNILINSEDYASKPFLDLDTRSDPRFSLCDLEGLEVIDLFLSPYDKPKDFAKFLLPYFIDANKANVSSNRDFGTEFSFKLLGTYQGLRKTIREKERIGCDIFVKRAMEYLQNSDWEKEMSQEVFNVRFRNALSGASLQKPSPLIKRIINDKVDNRLEYRRQVLSSWINVIEPQSYEEAIKIVEGFIKTRSKRLKLNKSLGAVKVLLEKDEELLNEMIYLRQLLGSEKNFVEVFMKK